MTQQQVLFERYFSIPDLKAGKKFCPCCARAVKAHGINLNKNLVRIAGEIYDFASKNGGYFNPKDHYTDTYFYTQFQKLRPHGIIGHKDGKWFMTKVGRDFLEGKIALPRKVWVYPSKPKELIIKDDTLQKVWQIEPKWQFCSQDYKQDYILQTYNTNL